MMNESKRWTAGVMVLLLAHARRGFSVRQKSIVAMPFKSAKHANSAADSTEEYENALSTHFYSVNNSIGEGTKLDC